MIQVGSFVIGEEERKAINDVLDSGRISEGPKVAEFEREFAKYIGTKYCVAVNSGTSALLAALYTLKNLFDFKDGEKVMTHEITFVATHNAIRAVGFVPEFNDQKPNKARIGLPVHLMGYPQYFSREFVIEDCSQAHGSQYELNGPCVGTRGLMGTFSFYIAHNIQAGEMGAVVTNDEACYRLLKKIKAHGRVCDCPVCLRSQGKCPRTLEPDPRFTYDTFGLNFKTMEFTAALALCQLKKADVIKSIRLYNVAYLNEGLKDLRKFLILPSFMHNVSYLAYPIYPVNIPRSILRQQLEANGIETRPLFNHPTGFYIGCHQYLTKEDLDTIVQVFHRILHPYTKL